jgi:hypothetical protein
MKPMKSFGMLLGICAFLSLIAADPASKPAVGPDTSIARDQYHFPAPPVDEWKAIKPDPASDSITFLNKKGDGVIQLVVLPKDASDDPAGAGEMVRQIKLQRAEKHVEMVMGPKIEIDKRFQIVIHEKYKAGDHVADQIHVWASVGPRVLMLTVNSVSDDADKSAAIHAAGEDMLAATKFNRKAFKKDN